MFAVELKFEVQARGAADERTDAITSLIGALERNGNLVNGYVVSGESKAWTVHAIAPGRDAFHKSNWNESVRQSMGGLARVNLKGPRIRYIGKIPETSFTCQCAAPTGFYLFTTFLDVEPPLRCIRCNGTVPLYRLPSSQTGEHSRLLSWQSNYQACDTLQINCGFGERFGERQMSDPASGLSRLGLAACRKIEGLTGRPVYYYLYRGDAARSRVNELSRRCPTCGGQWFLKKPLHGKFDFRCDHCKLLSNIAWGVR